MIAILLLLGAGCSAALCTFAFFGTYWFQLWSADDE
jgi:hypothetical protein